MTSLAFATLFQASILATGATTYDEAYKSMNETGKPLVVMVGADWCPACVTMKKRVMPVVEKSGVTANVALAYVNVDQQGKLANQLTGGGPMPQLLMFHKSAKGEWKRETMIGAHSAAEVQSFIGRAKPVAATEAASPVVPVSSRGKAQE